MPVIAVSTFLGVILAALIVIPIAALWCFAVYEIIKERHSGWGVVGWLLLVFVLPIIGAIIYFAFRPPKEDSPEQVDETYMAREALRQESAARDPGQGMYR